MRSLFPLLTGLLLPACLLDATWKHRYPTEPEDLDDGWEISTPEEVGLDPQVLAGIHDQLLREDAWFATLGFLVVKDGKLVFETYVRDPADRDRLHHIQSATKSVTSMLYGVLQARGEMPGVSTPLCDLVGDACQGLGSDRTGITLEHLLTMRSGIDFDNDIFSLHMCVKQPEDPLRYILERPSLARPGELYEYRDADPQLLGLAIRAVTGRNEEDLARELLFEPMGIETWHWERCPPRVVTAAHGLFIHPRDYARIGWTMLDQGHWQGTEVVPSDWRDLSTRSHVEGAHPPLDYGYLWWVAPDDGVFAAWGHGGQHIVVVPEHGLVVVQVAMPDGDLHGSELTDFIKLTRPLWQ